MTLRTKATILADHQRWLHYAREAGRVPVSESGDNRKIIPSDASDWNASVLSTYARDRGRSWSAASIMNASGGFRASGGMSWGQMGSSSQEMSAVITNSATADLCENQFGVDPSLAEVAVETIRDGQITENEVESMCASAGAIGGAVIGQAFGIPAPIGAFVGGLAGQMIGGVVSSVLGMGGGPSPAEIARARASQEAAHWNEWMREVQRGCDSTADRYLNHLDTVVRDLTQKLDEVQRQLGGQELSLVWSGDIQPESQGGFSPFYSRLSSVRGAEHKEWSVRQCANLSTGYTCSNIPREKYTCALPQGCAIPVVGGSGSRSQKEVINALIFYGAQWREENQRYHWFCENWPTLDEERLAYQIRQSGGRVMCSQYGSEIPSIGYTTPVVCEFYRAAMREAQRPAQAMSSLLPARLLVEQSIVKTGSIALAQQQIAAERHALATEGANTKRSAWQEGQRKTWLANNGMLLAGLAILGFAIWQSKKERRL